MRKIFFVKLSFLIIVFGCGLARAQTNQFTYQGSLKNGGNPANGNYDFQFALFDVSGNQLGSTITLNNVAVNNGVFSVLLNFGDQFTGPLRYLEIRVRQSGGSTFTTLSPRQFISNSPYSVKSLIADVAAVSVNSSQLGGISASGFIQNTTSQQSSSNFNISGNGIIGGNLGLGTVPGFRLDAVGRIRLRQLAGNFGDNNSAGMWLFQNTPNADRAFIGMQNDDYVGFYGSVGGWGLVMNTQDGNVGIGTVTPSSKLFVNGTGGIRATVNSDWNAGLGLTLNNQPGWSVATVAPGQFQIFNDAIGANAFWIDPTNNNVGIGTTSPNAKLEVNGKVSLLMLTEPNPQTACYVRINIPGTPVGLARLTDCGSSRRYKQNIKSFGSGLDLVNRLRPVSFDWKGNGKADMGLIAEEVAEVEPLLATYNEKGEVEGVKYERIGVVLINAVKEQQTQIEMQQKLINEQRKKLERQQSEIDALKAIVCSQNETAAICQPEK